MIQLTLRQHGNLFWLDAQVIEPTTGHASRRIPALVDTGAFMSAVPQSLIQELKDQGAAAIRGRPASVTYANGAKERRPTVLVEVELIDRDGHSWRTRLGRSDSGRGMLLLPKPHVLIGMDILTRLRLEIDGPNAIGFLQAPS